jgi:hypothetical protein
MELLDNGGPLLISDISIAAKLDRRVRSAQIQRRWMEHLLLRQARPLLNTSFRPDRLLSRPER